MKIYSVLITSNYDGEDLALFTSLRNAFEYVKEELDSAMEIHDIENLENDFYDFSYKILKNNIIQSVVNSWTGHLYSDYRTSFQVTCHNTNTSKYSLKGSF